MQTDSGYLKARRIWMAGFFAILTVHVIWQSLNRMPPVWDMAFHQQMGWSYYEAARNGHLLESFARLSDYYPPLYYLVEALVYGLFGVTRWLPLLANLPGLFLAAFFSFRIAWEGTRSTRAGLAGHLVLLFPLVAWTSRESLLDPTLTGLVAAALFVLLRSRSLEERTWSWMFGAVTAAGLLVKWTFILFIIPATVWSLLRTSERRTAVRNLMEAVLLAMPLVFWWYLPNLVSLYHRFQLTAAGAGWEQDPPVWSWLGWIYYPRCLSGYYLFLPLTIAFVWLVPRLWSMSGSQVRSVIPLMAVTLVGGLVLLSLLRAKDPRYVMPLTVPLAVMLVTAWKGRWKVVGITGWAAVQFLLVSFSVPLVPEKIALFSIPGDTDYISMRQEWVLFESDYFGVTGPPRCQDWHYRELLDEVSRARRVGFVPDAAFYHPGALSLLVAQNDLSLDVVRLGLSADWPRVLETVDYVVGKTGSQGLSYITQFNGEVYGALETLDWPLIASWDLPDGSRARLWRNPSRSR